MVSYYHNMKYITDLLQQFNMIDSKATLTPMASTPPLSKHGGELMVDREKFRHLVGSLQYVTLTKPTFHSVNKLAQFMHQLTQDH